MTKRSFRGKPQKAKGPKASGGDMMAQLQKMQAEMGRTQESLAQETFTVTAGGGAITVVITGHQRIQAIAIAPELLNPEDAEMLQDMLVAGINNAIETSQAKAAERLEGLTGGLDLGGLLGGV